MVSSALHLVQRFAAALADEGGASPGAAPIHPVALITAAGAFAVVVVALATLMALGLDALVHLDVLPNSEAW